MSVVQDDRLHLPDNRGPQARGITIRTVRDHPTELAIGDVVQIDGRCYDVVPDKQGGATLEPAITVTADESLAEHGLRPLTPDEFEELFGELPSDGEG